MIRSENRNPLPLDFIPKVSPYRLSPLHQFIDLIGRFDIFPRHHGPILYDTNDFVRFLALDDSTPMYVRAIHRPSPSSAWTCYWASGSELSVLFHCQRRKMTLALTPPKPNPFEIACSIVMRLASRETRSTPSAAASPFSRLRVGGATWSRNARIVKIASAPPAAPNR